MNSKLIYKLRGMCAVILFTLSFSSFSDTLEKGLFESKQVNEETFTGHAYSLETGALLYTEHHSIFSSGNNRRSYSFVEYKSPDSTLIASKSLEYDKQGYFPSFHFFDLRTDHIMNVEKSDSGIMISQVGANNQTGEIETETVAVLKNDIMIADAGFDVFMMKNWALLVDGGIQKVEFLAPTRNRFVSFKIVRTKIGEEKVSFRLAPDNFFIAMLVDPIHLEYEIKTGRILSYKGLTNIEEVIDGELTGDNYLAHIKYSYPESTESRHLSHSNRHPSLNYTY